MPRAYTDQEAAAIRADLLRVGRERFTAVGLSRVVVAELTTAVGIGKGSFYLFFSSKEALFFAIQEHEESAFKSSVEAALAPLEIQGDGRALLQTFFALQSTHLQAHPFLRRLLEPGTVAALARKLPSGALEAHQRGDAAWLQGLQDRWGELGLLRPDLEPGALFAVSAALFALGTTQDHIAPVYDQATSLLARSLARELGATVSPTARTLDPAQD